MYWNWIHRSIQSWPFQYHQLKRCQHWKQLCVWLWKWLSCSAIYGRWHWSFVADRQQVLCRRSHQYSWRRNVCCVVRWWLSRDSICWKKHGVLSLHFLNRSYKSSKHSNPMSKKSSNVWWSNSDNDFSCGTMPEPLIRVQSYVHMKLKKWSTLPLLDRYLEAKFLRMQTSFPRTWYTRFKVEDDIRLRLNACIAPHRNEDSDTKNLRSDCCMCSPAGIRLVAAVASTQYWCMVKVDVEMAFRQFEADNRKV